MFCKIFNKNNLKRRLAQVVSRLKAAFTSNTMRLAHASLRLICILIFFLFVQNIEFYIFTFLKFLKTLSIKSAPNHAPKKKTKLETWSLFLEVGKVYSNKNKK